MPAILVFSRLFIPVDIRLSLEMITVPTVLVLGAGASYDYGFPTGNGLLKEVHSKLCNSGEVRKLVEYGANQNILRGLATNLPGSGQLSIDAFLEHHPDWRLTGKIAMAYTLIEKENHAQLFDIQKSGKSWYHYLYQRLDSGFGTFGENRLSIVTFNYDRSIEHFLMTAMMINFGRPDDECADILKKIPIVHVHGQLGRLPWQSGESRPYENSVTQDAVRIASEQIIIMSEGDETSPEFNKAHTLMRNAERVYFLGFGYNTMNLKRLRIHELENDHPRLVGSRFGLGNAELDTEFPSRSRYAFSGRPGDTTLDFLKNDAPLG